METKKSKYITVQKSTFRAFFILLCVMFILSAFTVYSASQAYNRIKAVKIIKSTTECFGKAHDTYLTSVVYIDLKGDTVAQDYLTYEELCNIR